MPSKKRPASLRPSEVFADNLRGIRERRRWTQQDLADRLAELGAPTDRATIARTETRQRGVSLDDAFLYAAAVGASPLTMTTVSAEGNPIAIAPNLHHTPYDTRDWIRGNLELRPEDARTYQTEVPEEDWIARQRHFLSGAIYDVNRLVRAFADDNRDDIPRLIDQINTQLTMLATEEATRGKR
jgi:transcriptional regulator with XRE-family HTH domain